MSNTEPLATPRRAGLALAVASIILASGWSAGPRHPVRSCVHADTTLTLPPGFCATVFADRVGAARHVAVASNGDVFVQLLATRRSGSGGIVAMRDRDGDGVADTTMRFGEVGGTGIAIHGDYLYADDRTRIVRYPLASGSLSPSGPAEAIVVDLPTGGHEARNFAFGSGDAMFVNVGSATNSCQKQDRAEESPGIDPCTELDTRAGIWEFDANRAGQSPQGARHFAMGIRNAMGLAVDPTNGKLYATQHGRDQLYQNWPKLFTAVQGAENPAEELVQVSAGDDFGWPYCFFSVEAKRLVLAPEYGGDGKKVGRCAGKKEPITYFPGHWAPMSLAFYTGSRFPVHYRDGAFIAFHGSWNRAPEPQAGYRVVFVPMRDGAPSGPYETFANGFAGARMSPGDAAHRPSGLAVAPDGSLFVTDDRAGRVWRITYEGEGAARGR